MTFFDQARQALHLPQEALTQFDVQGTAQWASVFPVTDFAVAAVGAAGMALAELIKVQFGQEPRVVVDRKLASLWFSGSIRPIGWRMPAMWDSIAGDYKTQDGWIRLHTNAPHHKAAVLKVLQCADDREAVAKEVAKWPGEALETVIVEQKGCAAVMRSLAEWQAHPQGKAVAAEPLIAWSCAEAAFPYSTWQPEEKRPLAGLKVLDLTRVLAGPIATRFLAGYGAEVLRLDPPEWDEPAVTPEVTLGKRCARLDIKTPAGRKIFEGLLGQADVLVHGYRPDALARLGYGEAERRTINPGLIDVSLNAYGWTGPWAGRRGFDSLLQMSSGIAHCGMQGVQSNRPTPLPVQALDHATGYLMAAATLRALVRRVTEQQASTARLSLARVAHSLIKLPRARVAAKDLEIGSDDLSPRVEKTPWGEAKRCKSPLTVGGLPLIWQRPASRLGAAEAKWEDSAMGSS
ncbi:CoA transferase [Ewingella americana]|uniref:CoA transferase n=1 Tax=Ewingella americana TaxID=41202 RepID=UPI001F1DB402|nr:CoA transferase [Ewingella americana]